MARPKAPLPYIQMEVNITDHYQTIKFQKELGITRVEAVGYITSFLTWVGRYSAYGVLTHIDDDMVAGGSMWEGDPGKFMKALVTSGWIDEGPDCRSVHGWLEIYGDLLSNREYEAEKKRKQRAKKDSPGDIPGTTQGQYRDVPGMSAVEDSRVEDSRVEYSDPDEAEI